MSKNLPSNPSLLIISDTGMYVKQGKVYAFSPVVHEIVCFLEVFDSITWIGFNRSTQQNNASYSEVTSEKVHLIGLKEVGGTRLLDKAKIFLQYPKMYRIIHDEIKKHDYIHCRAPSNPSYIAMLLANNYPNKRFWFKYAGSWVDKASFFYDFQRKKLQKLKANSKITVNGNWDNQPSNVLAFENPCLTLQDREKGKDIIKSKDLEAAIHYCFVGGLNTNKGILRIIKAFQDPCFKKNVYLHVVGSGTLLQTLKEEAVKTNINIQFYGNLSKQKVQEVYAKSNFIILASQTEGFPIQVE